MRHRLLHVGCVLTILMGSGACAAPRILGKATLVDESGAPLPPPPAPGVTLNFINLGGKIEESVVSVQTDVQGKYRSPELPPGKYTVLIKVTDNVKKRTISPTATFELR